MESRIVTYPVTDEQHIKNCAVHAQLGITSERVCELNGFVLAAMKRHSEPLHPEDRNLNIVRPLQDMEEVCENQNELSYVTLTLGALFEAFNHSPFRFWYQFVRSIRFEDN